MSKRPCLLVVDDKKNMLRLMAKVMQADMQVLSANNGTEALAVLEAEAVDLVLCDLKMPDLTGLQVLEACKRLRPRAEFVLMTAYATVETAVEALKLGAYDYLTKPFEPEQARTVLLQALALRPKAEETPTSQEVLPAVVARSDVMVKLADLVRRVANSDATTLLLGETGTGKERLARAVHQLSPRSDQRFVALNCAAVPTELLESELFGHVAGAFTGAVSNRAGIFEEADGGTLFLDEIGDMPLALQAKLTRALEERTVRPLGQAQERSIDVRLVAATHHDLEAMVGAGSFREDLWYRLNVAAIHIPPLRERREDIELLALHFLERQRRQGRSLHGFSEAALKALQAFDWPGNVRQLRSAVERASVVCAHNVIELSDLPPELLRAKAASVETHQLAEGTWAEALEIGRANAGKAYLQALMKKYEGRVAEAAAHAGVERESFYRLLRKHEVDAQAFRVGSQNPES